MVANFKSKKQTNNHDIWTSEIKLRDITPQRRGKVNKLLLKLDKEGFLESVGVAK